MLESFCWLSVLACHNAEGFLSSALDVASSPKFRGICGLGRVLLGCMMGEGFACALLGVTDTGTCPCSVSADEGVCFAALGKLILKVIRMLGAPPLLELILRQCTFYQL